MKKLNTLQMIGLTATLTGIITAGAIVGTKCIIKKINEKKANEQEDKILQLEAPKYTKESNETL